MNQKPADDLGRVSCSLRGRVEAGSWQTCVLTYTAGQAGIDDTGSIKITCRYASDSGTPQFDHPAAPHYTTAVASNSAHLQLRYDTKDNRRPWGKTIQIKVLQGYLRRGDTISLSLGDRSGGSPGWRIQTFCEKAFELKVLVDRYATYVYEELAKSPTFDIVAGPGTQLVAIAPTQATAGKTISVRVKREDRWGNPAGRPWTSRHRIAQDATLLRLPIVDPDSGLRSSTNPIIVAQSPRRQRYWADLHGQSQETIGTNSIESYFRFARDRAFVDIAGHQGNDFQITDAFWQTINLVAANFNRDGRFVVFPGWEWSGNTGLGGDRNVFFREEGGPILRSSRALVAADEAQDECSQTVEQLFERLRSCGRATMLIPHVGGRFADLRRHSKELEPVVEVHSAWGTFEWMLEDAFRLGYRIGIVANSDGHKGRPGASYPGASTFGSYGGLTCVLADRLDRQSVWDAYTRRRVYATTGARIYLDVSTQAGHEMGEVVDVNGEALPEFRIRVVGTSAWERIEIRNAMRVLKTIRPSRDAQDAARIKILWQGAEVRGRGRQVTWDGGLKIRGNRIRDVQPVNFWNPDQPCRRLSERRLQWQSTTTGGSAGLILTLDRPQQGNIEIATAQKSFSFEVGKLSARGKRFQLGGVGKQIAAYPLPLAPPAEDWTGDFTASRNMLVTGDNPIYVCVVQEDGHMAWSSPIYLVR